VPSHQAEFTLLAETVNATLDRLEGAYQKLRSFTSDASHDLRSPLTAMRTEVEEAVMYPDDTDWPQTAKAVLAAIDRLQAIVTDLLTLDRLDANAPLTRKPTDLAQLVNAELDRRTPRKQIVTDLQPNVVIDCDRLRITRVLANLLDNAERHATSQITVTLRADTPRADGATAILEVIDDGPGITAEHREKVFERCTRLDAARNRDAARARPSQATRELPRVTSGRVYVLRVEAQNGLGRWRRRRPRARRSGRSPQRRDCHHRGSTRSSPMPISTPSIPRWVSCVRRAGPRRRIPTPMMAIWRAVPISPDVWMTRWSGSANVLTGWSTWTASRTRWW
jgi:hypothetical protein